MWSWSECARGRGLVSLLVTVMGVTGCGSTPEPLVADGSPRMATALPRDVPDPGRPRLVALGDSLTAGLGLAAEESYPARLQEKLDTAGYRLEVVNAGVSGDTSAGGRSRLEWALEGDVRLLIVALGGNDGLRGLPVDQLEDNLAAIIAAATRRDVRVLLAGMEAPPNFGAAYTEAFRAVYHELAEAHDVVFVPFLLDGVAGVAELNQNDGIHPNAQGAGRVAEHLWPAVESMARHLSMDTAPTR